MNTKKTLQLVAMILLVVVAAALSYNPISKSIKLGLDLQGGLHVVLQAVETPGGPEVTREQILQVQSVMEQRVNGLGVTEPIIQPQGNNRLVIELPGVQNPEEAINLIGRTALLTFRTADGTVVVEGKDLKKAKEALSPRNNQPEVLLEMTAEGTKKFADATQANVGKQIGIFLDNDLLQNPRVNEPILTGQASITGYSNLEEARNIAMLLNSGALPVKMEIVEKRTVGPTLGADSLEKSKIAGMIGIGLIFAFMVAYYRLPGVVAVISLVLYSVIVLGALTLLKATLTLPGIAGFLLSIGMAVDANVIIYERLKEELRRGKTLRVAIEDGFNRAMHPVVDSNVTSLIAVAVLFFLGHGTIKGFAVTLGIGVLASLFTAITFTHYLLRLTHSSGLFNNSKLYGA
ncbi:protein translocase subunit SecD [Heliophilum fasciatum]|uniref:Protein translocase subunit SecD n=1 Tax=Heliophilum fasciatum TaxID=35700 RepID=A0A4R2RNQ1_9FIRM|nr:protein translocase subunit SecD [Heliophilum fasciatum]MCW2278061.1 preprotein translocase subunit SecD [Heliophilum fasciatum]TCP64319.1 preprotein translocase subunit SecD [Heliophilum fasciatum]